MPLPRQTVDHTFADGITRPLRVADALLYIRLEEQIRQRTVAAIKQHAPDQIERIINEQTREILFDEVLRHIATTHGMRSLVVESILDANPELTRDEAKALTLNLDDLAATIGKVSPKLAPPVAPAAGPAAGAAGAVGGPASASSSTPSPVSTAAGEGSTPGT